MGTYKLVLDDDIGYDFTLIAIHCSLEPYYLAFLLNKHLKTKLARSRQDVQMSYQEDIVHFAFFEFEDVSNYRTYQLIENRTRMSKVTSNQGLFGNQDTAIVSFQFMQELPKVDYLIRITEDGSAFAKAQTITTLNQIPQIVTAYPIDVQSLKAKENLIFE